MLAIPGTIVNVWLENLLGLLELEDGGTTVRNTSGITHLVT
jgi:hypothetical protein